MTGMKEIRQAEAGRRAQSSVDRTFLILVLAFTLAGVALNVTASYYPASTMFGDAMYFVKRQAFFALAGLVVMALVSRVAPERLVRLARPAIYLTAICLALTFLPQLGVAKLGASRWIRLGFLSFQPSELAKPVLAFYLATVLAHRPQGPLTVWYLGEVLGPPVGIMGLVACQPDLGTTIVLGLITLSMLIAGKIPGRILVLLVSCGLVIVSLKVLHTPYQMDRITAFLDPWKHQTKVGYQICQSLKAIGSGGVLGEGFGGGKMKLGFLPIQYTDFIFSVLAEELGLWGGVATIGFFALLAQRGLGIAARARTYMGQLLTIGIVTGIAGQAFLNIAVVIAAVPTTGVPLPFLSYGGTSLVFTLAAVGMVLAVSRSTSRLQVVEGGAT